MRGTAAGEGIVSQAQTREWDENHERIFGQRKPQRGRWILTPDGLVPAGEYTPAARALDAPIMVDRFMEGSQAQDGADISTRAKRKEYMRRNGVADASDVSSEWCRKRREAREARTAKSTHDTVAELSKVDTRNLRNAVEQLKGKR